MTQYILAVPNFSDGRHKDVIEAVVDQVRNVPGVKLLDYHPDPDFNRTVVTVIGRAAGTKGALLNMAGKSIELINMEEQSGSHPRIGAQDTIPIFPLRNISLGECIELAEEIGSEVYKRLGVPVYFIWRKCPQAGEALVGFYPQGPIRRLQAGCSHRRPATRPRPGRAASQRWGGHRQRWNQSTGGLSTSSLTPTTCRYRQAASQKSCVDPAGVSQPCARLGLSLKTATRFASR